MFKFCHTTHFPKIENILFIAELIFKNVGGQLFSKILPHQNLVVSPNTSTKNFSRFYQNSRGQYQDTQDFCLNISQKKSQVNGKNYQNHWINSQGWQGWLEHIRRITRTGHRKFKLNSATAKLQEVFRNRKSASLR